MMFILVLIFMIVSLFIFPWAVISFLALLFTAFPITLCLLVQVIRFTEILGYDRSFSISNREIIFDLPKKPPFKIKWSQFNTIHIFKQDYGSYDLFPYGIDRKIYKINFVANNQLIA
ncbi:MAG: hypothetical protein GF353_24370 [Candidatus Lokiarchaeota archaeon]|nr:hypothetical protein [Candidatus Lokiarchaeota archaeon]